MFFLWIGLTCCKRTQDSHALQSPSSVSTEVRCGTHSSSFFLIRHLGFGAMRYSYAAAALFGAASASPYARPDSVADYIRAAGNTPTKAASSTQEPCAQVSSALAQGSNSNTAGQLDADMAMACLRSVPLDKKNAPAQLLGMQTMVDFQSTLAYLKDPPSS